MSDDKSQLDSVLRRVQKLLAIANDDRANPAEAAAAAYQAEKVMRAYQIEHADVIQAQLKRDDSFDQQDIGGTMNPAARARCTTTWAGMLSLAIARLNDCKSEWARSGELGMCIRYSGFRSDTQVARWTHLYIVNKMGQALRAFQRETDADRKESERFRKGFVVSVIQSINRAIEAKKAEMAEAVTSRALVVSKMNAVAERFGKQTQRNTRYDTGGEGYARGREEGAKVDVGRRAVGGQSAGAVLLG